MTTTKRNDVIANYGLYWERDKVNWWPGRQGRGVRGIRLLGKPYSIGSEHDEDDENGAVNFSNQLGIYLLHNGMETVYVGQTTNDKNGLFQRLRSQGIEPDKGPLWDRFSWFGFKKVRGTELSSVQINSNKEVITMRTLIRVVETVTIQACLPRLNGQSGQHLGQAYLQVRDQSLREISQTEEPAGSQ